MTAGTPYEFGLSGLMRPVNKTSVHRDPPPLFKLVPTRTAMFRGPQRSTTNLGPKSSPVNPRVSP